MSPFHQHFGEERRVMSESIPSQSYSGGTAWGIGATSTQARASSLRADSHPAGFTQVLTRCSLKAWDSLTPAWLPERACPRLAGTPWPLWS